MKSIGKLFVCTCKIIIASILVVFAILTTSSLFKILLKDDDVVFKVYSALILLSSLLMTGFFLRLLFPKKKKIPISPLTGTYSNHNGYGTTYGYNRPHADKLRPRSSFSQLFGLFFKLFLIFAAGIAWGLNSITNTRERDY